PFFDASLRATMLQNRLVNSLSSVGAQYRPTATVADGLCKPSRRNGVPPGVIVDGGTWQQCAEVFRKPLCFQENSLAPFRVARHVGIPDRLPVVMRRNSFGNQHHDMIAARAKLLLQRGSFGGPKPANPPRAVVPAVSCG